MFDTVYKGFYSCFVSSEEDVSEEISITEDSYEVIELV